MKKISKYKMHEDQFNSLETKCKSLRAILVASINTAKENKQ